MLRVNIDTPEKRQQEKVHAQNFCKRTLTDIEKSSLILHRYKTCEF